MILTDKNGLPYEANSAKGGENPFNTAVGQEVVSIQEPFWARMRRLGNDRVKATPVAGEEVTAFGTQSNGNTFWDGFFLDQSSKISGDFGFRVYPIRAMITCSVDALICFGVGKGNTASGSYDDFVKYQAFMPANTPLILTFDGEIWVDGTSSVSNAGVGLFCGVSTDSTDAKMWSMIQAVEVPVHA